MDIGFAMPPDDFLANWLEADCCNVKHEVEPTCYLSRQGHKVRRIKNRLQNYMFITETEVSFTIDQFRAMLSAYLQLNCEFQLLKVEDNKFVLTLETQMPTDYACAVLEEGRMIRLGRSNIIWYPIDEYAEGYFGKNLAYDIDDEVADMYIEVQIHALPLHLRTIKAIERILVRYCVVHTVDADCLSSKRLECVSCACWAQRGITFPNFIIIKLLQQILGVGKDINLCSQPFSWLPWSTYFGAVNESLPRKINIRIRTLPTEFFTPTVLEDLLSPFCMFDTDGYHPGSSPDINDYRGVVWTDKKRSIPSIIVMYAAPTFCETIIHPKGEVVELTDMEAYNTGVGLEAED